jgi:hypothetical protein
MGEKSKKKSEETEDDDYTIKPSNNTPQLDTSK